MRVDHRFNDNNSVLRAVQRRRRRDCCRPQHHRNRPAERQLPAIELRHAVPARSSRRRWSTKWKAGVNRSTLHRDTIGPLPPSVAVAGFMTLNQPNGLIEVGTSYSLIDNLVITRGRHTLKFGFEVRRAHVNVADPADRFVSVTYTNRPNFLANRVDSVAITGGAPRARHAQDVLVWLRAGRFQSPAEPDPESRAAIRVSTASTTRCTTLQGLRHERLQGFLPAGHAVVFSGPEQLRSPPGARVVRGQDGDSRRRGYLSWPRPDRRREHGAGQRLGPLLADHPRGARACPTR